ncbi:hypothetical protein [Flavobacterium sp.]|uniref:hypothetical protein n=1 Tax=Flavobacterium sp. TaxID=239 RepID=UPI0025E06D2A|nr:hypothetical protein [Flavobacterium sp.]
MDTKDNKQNPNIDRIEEDKKDIFPGYPTYPPSEDIYNNDHKEEDIDPEDVNKKKDRIEYVKPGELNDKDFRDDKSGSDLDVPGSELDDDMEDIGSEDEENNEYSIGGDNHNDLDEDNG